MGKNKRQREKARKNKKLKENENHLHVTSGVESTDRKISKQERTDQSYTDRAQQKSPNRKKMDSRSLTEHQQNVIGGDDSNTIKNEVGMSKHKDTCAADFNNSKHSEGGDFTDYTSDTINLLITHSTNETNSNEKERILIPDESRGQQSDENEHESDFNLDKTETQSLPTLKTITQITRIDCGYKSNDDDGGSQIEHIFDKENGQNINGHIQQPREELHKAGSKEDTGAVDFDNSGQSDQEKSQEDFTDQEIESDTIHSSFTHVTNESMNEDIHISDESRGQHSEENEYARSDDSKFVIADTQGKCAHANLNNSAVDTSSKNLTTEQALNGLELTHNVSKDEMNTLATVIGNHEQTEELNKENTRYYKENNDDGGFKIEKENGQTVNGQIQQPREELEKVVTEEIILLKKQLDSCKQESESIKVQIQQSVEEARESFHQELKTLQQQLESVTQEKIDLSECKCQLEQGLKREKYELVEWKEKAIKLESEKVERDRREQKLEKVIEDLRGWKEESVTQEEDKNQLEEQLLQVNDELERWKQNNARLQSQQAQSQQSMEETKNSFQQELANLQQQLESAKEENFNLLECKNQSERELETVTGKLDESREKTNELQNQNDEKRQLVHEQQLLRKELEECKAKLTQLENRKEQLNISTKAIEDTIKQEYSSLQRHLESNGSEGQDYTRLSDDKDRLEEELMHVNSELDEMKKKLVELENVKGEKDQLEQELDRMREIAGQVESMKEETERYRAQYQQINDQLRTTEQQLEQSYQECEGLSADLARKGEKEEHYRYIETMVVTLGREKESHLREIQELKNKVDLVEEVLSSLKEEKKRKDETIKQLKADVQVKEENSHQIKRQYEAGIEQLRTMGRSRDSEIETQKREIARITSQKQQLEENIFKTSIELKTKQSELQREQLELNNTRNTLTQYAEAIKKMNSQVQSKDKEIEIMQEEVNKIRIESREFQLKYRDLPQKEANFKVIENSNRFLIEENAQLQERIRSFGPFERTLHYLREENSRLSWEGQRYQERISFMEQKYRDQTYSIQQLNEEVQVFRGHRIELKRQLHQKTDEAESVSRRLKDTLEKKENLEKELLDTQEKKENLERELQGENPESQNFGDSHGPEGHNVQGYIF